MTQDYSRQIQQIVLGAHKVVTIDETELNKLLLKSNFLYIRSSKILTLQYNLVKKNSVAIGIHKIWLWQLVLFGGCTLAY